MKEKNIEPQIILPEKGNLSVVMTADGTVTFSNTAQNLDAITVVPAAY